MGLPWGQVVGFLSRRLMASSTGSEMTCSHLPASTWASAHDRPRMSVSSRSASRWRRTTCSASRSPSSVRLMVLPSRITKPSPCMRLIISDTAGRETPRRSATRAWMTATSSSLSSQIASQYSSNAGWNSGVWYSATAPDYDQRSGLGDRPGPSQGRDTACSGEKFRKVSVAGVCPRRRWGSVVAQASWGRGACPPARPAPLAVLYERDPDSGSRSSRPGPGPSPRTLAPAQPTGSARR